MPESRFNRAMNESMQGVSLIIMLVGAMVVVSIATCVLAPLALKPLLQRWSQAAQG